jgi:hypothetical protein
MTRSFLAHHAQGYASSSRAPRIIAVDFGATWAAIDPLHRGRHRSEEVGNRGRRRRDRRGRVVLVIVAMIVLPDLVQYLVAS